MSILVSIRQIKAARALVGMSQAELAEASGISLPTIKRLETGEGDLRGRATTAEAITSALQGRGVEFIQPDKSGGQGVRLRI